MGYAQAEVAPKWLFLAPVQGVKRLLDRIELPLEAFDLIEINEAFAAQTLADGRELVDGILPEQLEYETAVLSVLTPEARDELAARLGELLGRLEGSLGALRA